MTDAAEDTLPALVAAYTAARDAVAKIRDLIAPTNTQIPWMRCAEIEIFIVTEQQTFLRARREIALDPERGATLAAREEPVFPFKRPIVKFPMEANALRFSFEENAEFLAAMRSDLARMDTQLELMRKAVEG